MKTYFILLYFGFVWSKTLFLKCQYILEYISINFSYFANKISTLITYPVFLQQICSPHLFLDLYFERYYISIKSIIGHMDTNLMIRRWSSSAVEENKIWVQSAWSLTFLRNASFGIFIPNSYLYIYSQLISIYKPNFGWHIYTQLSRLKMVQNRNRAFYPLSL